MPDGNRKPETGPPDPDELAKLLELELMQKRAAWQQNKKRFGTLRILSFFFLFLVIAGGLLAFWLFFSPQQVSELRASHAASPTPTASP
jgi:flagellar basal body-associated protein FliL